MVTESSDGKLLNFKEPKHEIIVIKKLKPNSTERLFEKNVFLRGPGPKRKCSQLTTKLWIQATIKFGIS